MKPETRLKARKTVERHEGRRPKKYPDSKGIPSIAIGFNLTRKDAAQLLLKVGVSVDDLRGVLDGTLALTDAEIDALFDITLDEAIGEATVLFPHFDSMDDNAQVVVIDLIFNMGETGLSRFHQTVKDLTAGQDEAAAQDLIHSLWFTQVKTRGVDDINILEGKDATA
jgi:GH24 family phage-related lysozyme (muramidase)